MVSVLYLILVSIRKLVPKGIRRITSRNLLLQKSGFEEKNPDLAINLFLDGMKSQKKGIEECSVLIYGYGGQLNVALGILKRGAKHVYLYDKFVRLKRNQQIRYNGIKKYLKRNKNEFLPNPKYITILKHPKSLREQNTKVDVILSNSVLEHIPYVDSLLSELNNYLDPRGVQVHFVDLRDHIVQYLNLPFEMLCYSGKTWNLINSGWKLNLGSTDTKSI